MSHRTRAFSLTLLILGTIGGLPLAAESRLTSQPVPSNAQHIFGTWALQQISSIDELTGPQGEGLADVLDTPHLRGLSVRVTWNAIDKDFALLDASLALARAHHVDLSVRFMAGRHTPAHVFDQGSPFYLVPAFGQKEQNAKAASMEKVPVPFMPDGAANAVFEEEYDKLVSRLAAWCRENHVHLLHLAWYGQDWAELNNGREVRAAPGYSYEQWLNGHKRLIDIGLKYAGPDLAVEFPFSGHGPTTEAGLAFANHVIEKVGPFQPVFYCQANGWSDVGDWGAPDPATEAAKNRVWALPICRGKQAIQPKDCDWKRAYHNLRQDQATYCEVYVPSFHLKNKDQLFREIESFDHDCRQRIPMPSAK